MCDNRQFNSTIKCQDFCWQNLNQIIIYVSLYVYEIGIYKLREIGDTYRFSMNWNVNVESRGMSCSIAVLCFVSFQDNSIRLVEIHVRHANNEIHCVKIMKKTEREREKSI